MCFTGVGAWGVSGPLAISFTMLLPEVGGTIILIYFSSLALDGYFVGRSDTS